MELIIDLTGWIISITEMMSSNIIEQLPKESDDLSEKFIKTSGDLDDTIKALVGNTDMVDKKGKKT